MKKAVALDAENSEALELLDKAEAGKKRINFGVTPKPLQQDNAKTKPAPKPAEAEDTEKTPPPVVVPSKPAPTSTKPAEKKPGQ